MIVTTIKITMATVLLSLACSAVGMETGNENPQNRVQTSTTMFPDGLEHDFGTVQSGTFAKHAFRIVNTSNLPLRLISLRTV